MPIDTWESFAEVRCTVVCTVHKLTPSSTLKFTNKGERRYSGVSLFFSLLQGRKGRSSICMNDDKTKKGPAPSTKVCDNCFVPEGAGGAKKLSACARCGTVLYCSRNCQREHWKASHKHCCIAKADRARQREGPLNALKGKSSSEAAAGEKCCICLDPLTDRSTCSLNCKHVFHTVCVAQLRKFGVKQVCPLCRTELPAGPEKVNEEAFHRFRAVCQLVMQGEVSWSALPPLLQVEMNGAFDGWKRAAEKGSAYAQYNLGLLHDEGLGVVQSFEEAARWYEGKFHKAKQRGLI